MLCFAADSTFKVNKQSLSTYLVSVSVLTCSPLPASRSRLKTLQASSLCPPSVKPLELFVDAPSPPPQHPRCSSEPSAWRRERTQSGEESWEFSGEWCHFSTTITLINQVVHHNHGAHSLFRWLTVPTTCVRCTNFPVFWLFLLPIKMCYFVVLRMRSGNWFRQGVQMVNVKAKLLGGAYKSNTEVR